VRARFAGPFTGGGWEGWREALGVLVQQEPSTGACGMVEKQLTDKW